MKRSIDRALNLIVILACGTVIAVGVARLRGPRKPEGAIRVADAHQGLSTLTSYKEGERISHLDGVDFSKSRKTLVLFIRSSCDYCIKSLPFYREITNDPSHRRPERRIVVAGVEPALTLEAFTRQNHLLVDGVVSVRPETVRIRAAPTLVLVNSSGVIERIWVGEQPGARRAAIMKILGGLITASRAGNQTELA